MSRTGEPLAFPEISDPLNQSNEDPKKLIASGAYRFQKTVMRTQESHTGAERISLTPEDEDLLASRIYAGGLALTIIRRRSPDAFGHITDLGAASRIDEESLPKALRPHLKVITDAFEARNILIESHLRFATHRARMSMNILNPETPNLSDDEEKTKPKEKLDRSWQRKSTFTDITKLRSTNAVYDDRVQRSTMGLIEAAEHFLPHEVREAKAGKQLRRAKFLSHAAYYIDKELWRESLTEESSTLQVPAYRVAEIARSRKFPEDFTERQQNELAFIGELREHTTLDDINLAISAPEEVDNEWDEATPLALAEVVADYRPHNAFFTPTVIEKRDDAIEHVLDTLSEREAGVIRLRFGLHPGEYPMTLDEIGPVYGLTRERIRQIERKTLAMLRNPMRSQVLKDFVDEDLTDVVDRQYPYHQLSELPDEFAQLRSSGLNRTSEHVWHFSPARRFGRAGLESWQILKDEPWDLEEDHEAIPEYEEVARLFATAMWYPVVSEFTKHSGPEHIPSETIATILAETKRGLTPSHIEAYWNERLSQFFGRIDKLTSGEMNPNTIPLLFSKLLAETMTDDDTVQLIIPPELDGELNFVGTELTNGTVEIHGNLGDYTGYGMKDLATLKVFGNVGNCAANYMQGMATLIVDGDAGRYFGYKTTGENNLRVDGRIESFSLPSSFEGELVAGELPTRIPVHPNLRARIAHAKKK